jgi:hypothetical protein
VGAKPLPNISVDKNRRDIGKSQSTRPPKRTCQIFLDKNRREIGKSQSITPPPPPRRPNERGHQRVRTFLRITFLKSRLGPRPKFESIERSSMSSGSPYQRPRARELSIYLWDRRGSRPAGRGWAAGHCLWSMHRSPCVPVFHPASIPPRRPSHPSHPPCRAPRRLPRRHSAAPPPTTHTHKRV